MDEHNQMSTASRDPSMAFSIIFCCTRSTNNDLEPPARPTEQARAVISTAPAKPRKLERPTKATESRLTGTLMALKLAEFGKNEPGAPPIGYFSLLIVFGNCFACVSRFLWFGGTGRCHMLRFLDFLLDFCGLFDYGTSCSFGL